MTEKLVVTHPAYNLLYGLGAESSFRRAAEHFYAAQAYGGWTGWQLLCNWGAFTGYPLLRLMDVQYAAITFHAVTALMLVVQLGEMAWEQVK